jgi:phospholipase/lecithinase/hemolysin
MKVIMILFAMLFSDFVLATPLNNIVVFGDSLSDNGNLYEYMQQRLPLSPPYYEGRFSNGPVWVERLVNSYFPDNGETHLLDYAFGGAGIAEDGEDEALFTLKHEIDVYLLAHEDKADPQSLFTVWIGANNYLAVPEDVDNALKIVITGIERDLERLAQKGAKHILVVNTPDLGRTPAAREFDAEDKLSYLSKRHNEELANSFAAMQKKYPEVQWIYFDVARSFKEILDSPEDSGFKNIHDTCYDVIIDKPSHQSVLKIASKIKVGTRDELCDGFLFFDPVHTTALAHELMAGQIRNLLDSAGVEFE